MKNISDLTPKSLPSSPETMKNKARLSSLTAFYFTKQSTAFQSIPINKASFLASFICFTGHNETSKTSPMSFILIFHETMIWWYRRESGII